MVSIRTLNSTVKISLPTNFVAAQTHDTAGTQIHTLPDFSVNFEFLPGCSWSTASVPLLRKLALVYEV